jgi:tol-pal system-associated acyl-CoA thioesterase
MRKKIYYHDTDAGGIVYYANYLKYMEEARTEYFDEHGLGTAPFAERGLLCAVRSCQVVYKSPARYGDEILALARVAKFTGAQIFFDQSVVNERTGQILVEAQVALVCLDKAFKPQPVPAEFKEKLI